MLFDRMAVKDIILWNPMIKGCLDCRDLGLARRLFDERNIISWTTMVNGYLKFGKAEFVDAVWKEHMPQLDKESP